MKVMQEFDFTYRVFCEDGDWVAVVDQPRDWCRHLAAVANTPQEALRQLREEVLPMAYEVERER